MPNTPVPVNSSRKPQTNIGYENSINHLLIKKNVPCISSQIAFDFDSYLNNIDDGGQLKSGSFQTVGVFAQPDYLQQGGIIEKHC